MASALSTIRTSRCRDARVRWARSAACIIVVAATGACPLSEGRPAPEHEAAAPVRERDDQPTKAEIGTHEATLHDVEQRLVRQCMVDAGLEFAITPATALADQKRTAARLMPPPFGSDDVAAAKRHGYDPAQIGTDDGILAADSANQRFYDSLAPADKDRYDRLTGGDLEDAVSVKLEDGIRVKTSAVGCLADMRRLLYGNLARYIRLNHVSTNIENEARDRTRTDPRYERSVARWASCMQRAGFSFATWSHAYQAGIASLKNGKTIAVADARCADRTGSVRVAEKLFESHEQEVRSQRAAQLAAYEDLLARAVIRAEDLATK